MSSSTVGAPRGLALPAVRRRVLRALIAVAVLVVVYYVLRAVVSIDTNLLWFRSVDHESAYTRRFWTQALLFAIFGALMAAAVANTLIAFHRHRPSFRPDPRSQRWRFRFNRFEPRLRKLLFVVIVGYLSIAMGARATSAWQTWLQWRHSVPFHQTDPQFHRDVSYYVFVYPLHRLVLTYLFRIVATSLIVFVIAAYAYGGLRLRGKGPRMTAAVRAQLSLMLGVYLVLKGFAYWLDRYALVTSHRGVVTGVGYTDAYAVLPGRIVLMVLAFIAAAMLFANVVIRTPRLLWAGVITMVSGAVLVGWAWPAVVQQFREKPAASSLETQAISHNIAATRRAFGLAHDVTSTAYPGAATLQGSALRAQAARNAQIRLLDPNRVSPTFNVKQQIQAYYGFKSTLDIDRYPIGPGQTDVDVALAVRELNLNGLPPSRRSWSNTHLVYTHGYGAVAARTTTLPNGLPDFVEKDLPATGPLQLTQQRVYFGQMSPSYSIVGAPAGSKPKEFDRPSDGSTQAIDNTYAGGGGVPIGSFWHRLEYAWKLHSASVLFSSDINPDSQLLTVRNPRSRVAAVAPWLTLDGATYPTVVDGHIVWVVDGYTTSNRYPDSQQVNLRSATSSTLTQKGSTVQQPSTSINYLRNSVKATVDAYTGKVTLYAWDQSRPDPILQSWEKSFPGLIQPAAAIPAALVPHLRYPQDLFNVQRSLLTRYHVTNASQFYSGSDFWKVPTDPTVGATTRLNSVGKKVTVSAPTQPSVYMSLSPDGDSAASFALSSPLVTLNGRDLSAFLSVDSQPGPNYGRLTLLTLPSSQSVESPSQIQNDIESTTKIARQLTLLRGQNVQVVLGNLLTIPLGGRMLYVEPIYTKATSGASFPILQRVVAIYGNGTAAYGKSLSAALNQVLDAAGP